jgi:signal transduction histidine kinase
MATAAPHPAGFDEIRREELARMFASLFRVRRIFQPIMLLIMLSVVLLDGSAWRALVLLSAPLLAIVITWLESRRFQRLGLAAYEPKRDYWATPLVLPVAIVCTGGFDSPVLFALLPLMVFLPMFCTPRQLGVAYGLSVAAVLALALSKPHAPWMMPATFVGERGQLNSKFDLFTLVIFALFAVIAAKFGQGLRRMGDAMLERSLTARSEALELHRERLHELTLLSGEIAHELKNPLASIKALAQLMEGDASKTPERLRILRGEVDRMQGILEEFLNFSRPLVPLAQTQVDVAEVCRDVIELHEGVAASRRLTLLAPSQQLSVWCDPRKVKQILVNLVQNAVEASSAGGEVSLIVEQSDDLAKVLVLDRGHGLTQELERRAFDTGVTSKARGSGLGLTIVRMLAEQHGGSARLYNREGGGCVAELLLPRAAGAAPASSVQSNSEALRAG